MHVKIVKGKVCEVCGSPIGKRIDEKGKLLGYSCYGKKIHSRDATEEERSKHNVERTLNYFEI